MREFELLEYLLRHQGQVVSRETLARDVWKETARTTPLDNVIDVHIARLRRKVDVDQPVEADSHRARRRLHAARRRAVIDPPLVALAQRPHAADAVVRRRDGRRARRLRGGHLRVRQPQRVARRSTSSCAATSSGPRPPSTRQPDGTFMLDAAGGARCRRDDAVGAGVERRRPRAAVQQRRGAASRRSPAAQALADASADDRIVVVSRRTRVPMRRARAARSRDRQTCRWSSRSARSEAPMRRGAARARCSILRARPAARGGRGRPRRLHAGAPRAGADRAHDRARPHRSPPSG